LNAPTKTDFIQSEQEPRNLRNDSLYSVAGGSIVCFSGKNSYGASAPIAVAIPVVTIAFAGVAVAAYIQFFWNRSHRHPHSLASDLQIGSGRLVLQPVQCSPGTSICLVLCAALAV